MHVQGYMVTVDYDDEVLTIRGRNKMSRIAASKGLATAERDKDADLQAMESRGEEIGNGKAAAETAPAPHNVRVLEGVGEALLPNGAAGADPLLRFVVGLLPPDPLVGTSPHTRGPGLPGGPAEESIEVRQIVRFGGT